MMLRSTHLPTLVALLIGATISASSCSLNRRGGTLLPAGTGGSGAGTGGGGTAGTGGTDIECVLPTDCDGTDTECSQRTCVDGLCGEQHSPDGTPCGAHGGACDGAGVCLGGPGESCSDSTQCVSDYCTDGVCCDTACDGLCEGCGPTAPSPGQCAPHTGEDPDDDCGDGVCEGVLGCAVGSHVFSAEYGTNGSQQPWSLAVDSSKNIVVAGEFGGNVDFGGGTLSASRDAFVAKFGPDGSYVWAKQFGLSSSDIGRAVAVDSTDNIILCGGYAGLLDLYDGNGALPSVGGLDIFLVKLSPSGNTLWAKRFGDAFYQDCAGVDVDSNDNIVFVGLLRGTVNFGLGALSSAGGADVVVAKYDPQGTPLWTNRYGDAADQSAQDVAFDHAGNAIVAGSFAGSLNFGGTNLSAGLASTDIFLAKLTPAGAHSFSARFGDSSTDQEVVDVDIDTQDNILMAGHFAGTTDFGSGARVSAGAFDGYVAKFDSAGAPLWDHTFGDGADQWTRAVAADAADSVLIAGDFMGQLDCGPTSHTADGQDVFLAKYTADGTYLWSSDHGDAAVQSARAVETNADRQVIVSGWFDGSIDFGSTPLTSDGEDLFLAILTP